MAIKNALYVLDVNCFEDEQLFNEWHERMSTERKKKIDAYKNGISKRLSLGAGVLLEKALAEAHLAGYELFYNDQNKPFLKGESDIFFNISHSGNMACLAISDRLVGVDIEKDRHFADNLIAYVFNESDKETAKKLALWENKLDMAYTTLWTVKESIMKHSGMGIMLEPKKIILSVEDDEILAPKEPQNTKKAVRIKAETPSYDCSNLKFSLFDLPGYRLTVCSEYERFPSPVTVEL